MRHLIEPHQGVVVESWIRRPRRTIPGAARTLSALCLLCSLAALLRSSLRGAETISLTGRAMGTTWSVKFVQPAVPLDVADVKAQVTRRLEELEQQFSTYRPTSELSHFNRTTSTDWTPVSPELAEVAWRSQRLSELTGGAFDVTVAPLVDLWGFGPAGRISVVPSAKAIDAARERVDYHRLEVRQDPPALRKDTAETAVDFSSMAKGFAADAISELLLERDAPDHLAQIGGDTKSHGHPIGAPTWRVGVEQPAALTRDPTSGASSISSRAPSSPATDAPSSPPVIPAPPNAPAPPTSPATTLATTVALSGQALSTSGDAYNAIVLGGRRYGHIIDPRTGRPATGTLASVSVIADSCAESSALATALFVLGLDDGLALAKREHLAALFLVREAGQFIPHATPEFEHPRPPAHP